MWPIVSDGAVSHCAVSSSAVSSSAASNCTARNYVKCDCAGRWLDDEWVIQAVFPLYCSIGRPWLRNGVDLTKFAISKTSTKLAIVNQALF